MGTRAEVLSAHCLNMTSVGILRRLGPTIGHTYYRNVVNNRPIPQNIDAAYRFKNSSVAVKLTQPQLLFETRSRDNVNNSMLGLVQLYHCGASKDLLNNKNTINLSIIREKSSKKKGKKSRSTAEDEFSDDDFEDENIELKSGSDFKESLIKIDTLRMDSIIHVGFGMSRNKVDTAFYKGNILVNGKKPKKKSVNLHDGDEIDIIKGSKPENPDLINVTRVVMDILNYNEDTGKVSVKLRKYNQLLIESPNDSPFEKD